MSGDKALAVDLNAEGVAAEKFAADAATILKDNERLEVEASPSGVILRGVWEFDIEQAIEDLKEALAVRIEWSPSRIIYKEGPRLLEPIMKVRLKVPEDSLGDVIGDLTRRRGTIRETLGGDDGFCEIDSLAPLANMFGSFNAVQKMTGGRGKVDVDFHEYQHVPSSEPGPEPDEPTAAALRPPRAG